MARLRPVLDHGILELDNNTAERAMCSVVIGRKNYLFVGLQTGGKAAAIANTPIETAKLNKVDPQAWLADTLARIPDHSGRRSATVENCDIGQPDQTLTLSLKILVLKWQRRAAKKCRSPS